MLTDAEKKLIEESIYMIEPDVLFWKTYPKPTKAIALAEIKTLENISKNLEKWYIVADLKKTRRPNAQIRKIIINGLNSFKNLRLIVAFLEMNFLMKLAVPFMQASIKLPSKMVETKEEAIKAIEEDRKKWRKNA